MIWAENLTKYFDDFLAVDRVSLDVPNGQVLVLLGPNGAGKTTTIRMLTSILAPSSGRAVVNGFDVVSQPDQVRSSVGVLTEQHGLYGRMNAPEYLMFFGRLYGLDGATTRRRSELLLEKFGLAEAGKKRLGEYSKGMRQKLALARAMLHEPPVLLLDEPTSAMDPESARVVRDAIQLLKSTERTIVLCTHNLIEAEELADQIAIIRRGRIIHLEQPEELKRKLLGPMEYEAVFADPVGDWAPELPQGVRLAGRQAASLRFQVDDPLQANPPLLAGMVGQGRKVVTFQEVPRSLEAAYLEAVGRDGQGGEHVYNLRPVYVIVEREVRDQLRDWRIIFPVLGLTLFFPFLMDFTASQILNFVREYGATVIGERLVPFLMMIVGFFPISVSLVIALESFVGEKERGSIEPLLNSPLKDWQLYLGKLISSTLPPLISSYIGMLVYTAGLAIQGMRLPGPDLLVLILVITTVQAVVMVAGAVVVSSQATSVRAANLLASFIIIPMALLIQGESVIMFWGDYRTLWLVGFGLLALTVLLVRVGLAHFQREELLGREIDVLNLKWGWKIFWRTFSGESKNIRDWYLHSLPVSLYKLKRPALVTFLLAVTGMVVGLIYVHQIQIPDTLFKVEPSGQQIKGLLAAWPLFSAGPVIGIWWQNVRALLLGMVLGGISLGIFGLLPIMATMAVLGGILGIVGIHGSSPFVYFAGFILPHGLLEIPAAVLASAAVLQAGAILATPTPGRTVGEVFITSLGEWAKIMVGVVIPTLLVAAAVEAWLTPRIALLLFG